jgi:hypothetical protein
MDGNREKYVSGIGMPAEKNYLCKIPKWLGSRSCVLLVSDTVFYLERLGFESLCKGWPY